MLGLLGVVGADRCPDSIAAPPAQSEEGRLAFTV
jgi:hypothetical protein